jgi:glycosyltransferase involved in cell wall biosynthesis
MSGTPEVSFVMPVWQPNDEWLRRSVESALGQTGCDLELIVVDDGNPIPIRSVLDAFDDPRLHIVRVPHGGASAARNAGTAVAAAAHIRYIDADDVLSPGGTRRLLDRADGSTIVYGVTEVCDESLTPVRRLESTVRGDATAECLLGRFDIRHVSMVIPAEVANAAGPWDPDLSVCEDWDFVLRCVELAAVEPIDAVVTSYRRHPDSATRAATAAGAWRHGQRRVVEKYLERHPAARHGALGREAWVTSYGASARRALADRSLRAFIADVVALTRVKPTAALPIWREAAGVTVRGIRDRLRPRTGK